MGADLLNCWDIMNCKKNKGGVNAVFGECIAAKEELGHSCWAIAGTLCRGEVKGNVAHAGHTCMTCEVYKMYNRINGSLRKDVEEQFPEENAKYNKMLIRRLSDSYNKTRSSEKGAQKVHNLKE